MIVKDLKGNELLEMIDVEEAEVETSYDNVTHALVVVKVGEEYLLGWNKWRQNWEIFGGCIEDGETVRECIIREGYEELGIKDVEYKFIGLMHYKMSPGYFNPEWHEEYGALYGVTLDAEMMDVIQNNRRDKEEVEKLEFYSCIKGDEPIAIIDEVLLKYWN